MIVLDASVVLKWLFVSETNRERAVAWKNKHLSGEERIASPELLPYEIANVLAHKRGVSDDEALRGLNEILLYDLEMHRLEPDDFAGSLRLSRLHHISVYDASYVHLAQKLQCQLITADEKLVQMIQLPFVRLL